MVKVLLGDGDVEGEMLTSKELKAKIAEKELLRKPSLEGLAYLLRHEELWPDWYVYNWHHISSCAIGLASLYWGNKDPFISYTRYMMENFGLTHRQVIRAFISHAPTPWYRLFATPRPQDIARYIERRLLGGDKT